MTPVFVILADGWGPHSSLAPASEQARNIGSLWWIFCTVCTGVFVIVMIFTAAAILCRDGSAPDRPDGKKLASSVSLAVVLTVVILLALLVADFRTDHVLSPPATGQALTVKLTGHQWWWQVEYEDTVAGNIFRTANEFHLPLGRPVQLQLNSVDVIHSFWVPSLQGKKDLIPGHPTILWLKPDRAGTFNGQCAEFCGYQHAHMGLIVTVEPPEQFARWQEAQRQPARAPATDHERHGQQVFLTRSCVMCHAIDGTTAHSTLGPPLTHFASQRSFAAGAFPNNRDLLKQWIRDPQGLKPGVLMPPNDLQPDELDAVVDYLRSLQ